jgi:hypothetical protein
VKAFILHPLLSLTYLFTNMLCFVLTDWLRLLVTYVVDVLPKQRFGRLGIVYTRGWRRLAVSWCSTFRLVCRCVSVTIMTSTPKSTNEDVLGGKSVKMFTSMQWRGWLLLGSSFHLSLISTKSSWYLVFHVWWPVHDSEFIGKTCRKFAF